MEQIDADGADETREADDVVAEHQATLVVPPRENAVPWERRSPAHAGTRRDPGEGTGTVEERHGRPPAPPRRKRHGPSQAAVEGGRCLTPVRRPGERGSGADRGHEPDDRPGHASLGAGWGRCVLRKWGKGNPVPLLLYAPTPSLCVPDSSAKGSKRRTKKLRACHQFLDCVMFLVHHHQTIEEYNADTAPPCPARRPMGPPPRPLAGSSRSRWGHGTRSPPVC